MQWKKAVETDQGYLRIPKRWLHLHYYEALNILFRFENSLRVFVYIILKNEYLDKWKDCCFSMGEGEQQSLNSIAKKRIRQAKNFGYLGFDITAPLMHLTSGELVELIVSEAYWPKFKSYFYGNKEIIKNKLLEIGTIRNSLAHFRPIKPEDIELVVQNCRHALIGVEDCLNNIFNRRLRIPTNTQDKWYKSISTIGNDICIATPYYSENEKWVFIVFKFNSQILEKQQFGETFYNYAMTKINTPNILTEKPDLRKHITYIGEYLNYPTLNDKYDIEIKKDVSFVFSKDILVKEYELLSEELRDVVATITDEYELLLQDNLARGKIVESAQVTAFYVDSDDQEGKWQFYYDSLSQEYHSNHPDEYWGQVQGTTDVVAGCRRYPWMPSDISKLETWAD